MIKEHGAGSRIVVLSGGEPTIHPDFVEIIKKAKSIGYQHIRVITNGRMFAYRNFLHASTKAGLDQATISVHSHIPQVSDFLSKVDGSFDQILKGIKNCLSNKLDLKVNIVVCKMNIVNLRKTLEFFYNLGVARFGLLRLMPFGKAWTNRDVLFYNNPENYSHLKDALELTKKCNIIISPNRFDLEQFAEYPAIMQHPFKFVNEVEARIDEFQDLTKKGKKLFCYPDRCPYCFLENFCKELHETVSSVESWKDKKYVTTNGVVDPMLFAQCYMKRYEKWKT